MTQQRPPLQQMAMLYGTYLGLFWILKFAFLPLGLVNPLFGLLFILLTLAGPVWVVLMTRRYRNRHCGGELSYFQALIFCFQIYLFATILVAVGHYVYFAYIDHGFLYTQVMALIDEQEQLVPESKELMGNYRHAMEVVGALSPIKLTMQLISQNIFYAIFLALPTALIGMKRKRS